MQGKARQGSSRTVRVSERVGSPPGVPLVPVRHNEDLAVLEAEVRLLIVRGVVLRRPDQETRSRGGELVRKDIKWPSGRIETVWLRDEKVRRDLPLAVVGRAPGGASRVPDPPGTFVCSAAAQGIRRSDR